MIFQPIPKPMASKIEIFLHQFGADKLFSFQISCQHGRPRTAVRIANHPARRTPPKNAITSKRQMIWSAMSVLLARLNNWEIPKILHTTMKIIDLFVKIYLSLAALLKDKQSFCAWI